MRIDILDHWVEGCPQLEFPLHENLLFFKKNSVVVYLTPSVKIFPCMHKIQETERMVKRLLRKLHL